MDATSALAEKLDDAKGKSSGTSRVGDKSIKVSSFIQVQMGALALALALSGIVPSVDLCFALCMTVYFAILAWWRFPAHAKTNESLMESTTSFKLYIAIGGMLGIYLPLAYVLGGFARGDQDSIMACVPHLFLQICQVFTETIASSANCSMPVRILVPIVYNLRRLGTLDSWIHTAWSHQVDRNMALTDVRHMWIIFGRLLAVINVGFWYFNFFCFLLPIALPKAFLHYMKYSPQANGLQPHSMKETPESSTKKHE